MKAKHTPGPWLARCPYISAGIWEIALMTQPDHKDLHQVKEWAANARLIAAAPDLLEAIQLLAGCIVMGGDPYEGLGPSKPGTSPIAKARAAIAKAKGEAL